MPSSHLILCRPLLLLAPIPPSIRVFSSESALRMRWPKYWSFSFSISPSNEHPGLISFRMDWLDLLAVQGTLKSLLQHHSSKPSIFSALSFLHRPTLLHDLKKIFFTWFVHSGQGHWHLCPFWNSLFAYLLWHHFPCSFLSFHDLLLKALTLLSLEECWISHAFFFHFLLLRKPHSYTCYMLLCLFMALLVFWVTELLLCSVCTHIIQAAHHPVDGPQTLQIQHILSRRYHIVPSVPLRVCSLSWHFHPHGRLSRRPQPYSCIQWSTFPWFVLFISCLWKSCYVGFVSLGSGHVDMVS